VSSDKLRSKLKLKHLAVKEKLSGAHPHVDRFFKSKNLDPGKIRDHSARVLGAGAMAGVLFLKPPSGMLALPSPKEIIEKFKDEKSIARVKASHRLLVNTLGSVLPKRPRPLTRQEEKFLEQIFANIVGVKTRATLEGEHLNTTYGYIGAEQHLRRYPGDTLSQHGKGEMLKEGMAPGLGAWRYFAYSKKDMTPYLEEVEKWYAVVQTLYLPDWNTRTKYLREWYKYRKVLIVDVDNGRAVVASVADSGPAAWTGKHFGGSPEVMHYLGGSRYKKGRVVLFFVDDTENKIPLGPVDYENVPIAGIIN
jgi:hypothetical protein